MERGSSLAGGDLVDQLLLQQVHEQVELGLRRRGNIEGQIDALGVVETTTVAAAVQAADAALKQATVDLLELRIANGLGGRSYFTLTGEVSDVRAAVTVAASVASERGMLARDVVIPRPHSDLVRHL
jgi:microcompartment protein CcmL/EutN